MKEDNVTRAYASINGINMYYEVYGNGRPLVLIHGGGSTIQTCFENIIPLLAKHRQVIAMDLQAHGRTGDRPVSLSFTQDADDVAALLAFLQVDTADFLGFSNGGQTLFELALRHPGIVHKMIIASAFYKREAVPAMFWEGFNNATLEMMPPPLKTGFLNVRNDISAFENMFYKDVERMKNFTGWQDHVIGSINKPVLIISGTHDVASVEHAVEMYRKIPGAELVILPCNHGNYLGTVESLENGTWHHSYIAQIIDQFLDD